MKEYDILRQQNKSSRPASKTRIHENNELLQQIIQDFCYKKSIPKSHHRNIARSMQPVQLKSISLPVTSGLSPVSSSFDLKHRTRNGPVSMSYDRSKPLPWESSYCGSLKASVRSSSTQVATETTKRGISEARIAELKSRFIKYQENTN